MHVYSFLEIAVLMIMKRGIISKYIFSYPAGYHTKAEDYSGDLSDFVL